MYRPTCSFFFLVLLSVAVVHCQDLLVVPNCNQIDSDCVQNPEVVTGLKQRATPELPEFVDCYLKFADKDACTFPCFFAEDVFSVGGKMVGQCYPNITSLDIPQEESTNCFQDGTIWRKLFPCFRYSTADECEPVQECQWFGEFCGVNNATITEVERSNMAEAFQGLQELSTNSSNSSIVNQITTSLVPDASYYCTNVLTSVLFCSIQEIPLNSECGDVLAWFWPSEQDRQLFLELEKCIDQCDVADAQLKQTKMAGGGDEDSALQQNFVNAVSMSIAVLLLTLFMM